MNSIGRSASKSSKLAVQFDAKKVDAVFDEINQCHLPGAAVGLAIDGRPVYRKAFGLANMDLPIVLSPSMRIRIGSTSKHFTCLAYMLLCEKGKAGIDDPIGKYLPELHPVTREVTVRQLMANTSGLRDVYDVCTHLNGGEASIMSLTSVELLSYYSQITDVNAAPGTTWCYNNGNWFLLTLIIERIANASFEQVMWEHVFEPVGMYDTCVRRLDTDFLSNSASHHAVDASGRFVKQYWGRDNFVGAGAIVSTVDDMLRWLGNMDSPRVGSTATWATMKTPSTLPGAHRSTDYGLGLMFGSYRGAATMQHGGNTLGGSTEMLKVPAAGLDIIVMTNRQDANAGLLAMKIMDAVIPDLEPGLETNAADLKGTYRSPATHRVIQLLSKNGQQWASIGGSDLPFNRCADGVLRVGGVAHLIRQAITPVNGEKRPAAIRYCDYGKLDEMVAVGPSASDEGGSIIGLYRSASTGATATIALASNEMQLKFADRFGTMMYALQCLGADVWRAHRTATSSVLPWGGMLAFTADRAAFYYSSWQTWAMKFERAE